MLASFFSWWFARLSELLPRAWTGETSRARAGIVVDVNADQELAISLRDAAGLQETTTLGAAARLSGRKLVLLRPPPGVVLQKQHTVPTAPRRQLEQLLRYELARITPFPAEELFWRWDGLARPGDRTRTAVTLTMVPKIALAAAVEALGDVGLKAAFVEVGAGEQRRLLPIGDPADRSSGTFLVRGLAWACACLAVIALAAPFGLQALSLRRADNAIAELQPTITEVEALRQNISAGDAGREILARELDRTGDALQILAMVTRILPDDTFLTDFSLRERQMTLSGRSASAPHLITRLSADPAIRGAAFAAPVTRIEGATSDVFSIRAEVAK